MSKLRARKLSMKSKLVLSLLSIVVILLVSSVISVTEYFRMSNYVSGLVAEDVGSINMAKRLAEMSNACNLEILAALGSGSVEGLSASGYAGFIPLCDSLRTRRSMTGAMVDSVISSHTAYMQAARGLEDVVKSSFIDNRDWYLESLYPRYSRLQSDIARLTAVIYDELDKDSESFDRGFYRSIVPGIVAVFAGILLVFVLLFFILSYYVRPLGRMLDGLRAYRFSDRKYSVEFDGDDELAELNEGIGEIAEENRQLRRRLVDLRKK